MFLPTEEGSKKFDHPGGEKGDYLYLVGGTPSEQENSRGENSTATRKELL